MARATILVLTDHQDEWRAATEWIDRWRTRMAVCPDGPDGCLCCVASWDVDAPQEALDELPAALFLSTPWSTGLTGG